MGFKLNKRHSDEIYEKVGLYPFYDEYSKQYKVRQEQDGYVYGMNHLSVFSCQNWIDKQIDFYIENNII